MLELDDIQSGARFRDHSPCFGKCEEFGAIREIDAAIWAIQFQQLRAAQPSIGITAGIKKENHHV
jgi:hypothetical protein